MGPDLLLLQEAVDHGDSLQPLDRELLAVYSTICHFRLILEEREFFILTDHKPLCLSVQRDG